MSESLGFFVLPSIQNGGTIWGREEMPLRDPDDRASFLLGIRSVLLRQDSGSDQVSGVWAGFKGHT